MTLSFKTVYSKDNIYLRQFKTKTRKFTKLRIMHLNSNLTEHVH